ncbi:MAG: hypothetical protein U0869_13085 [Chloroflexota bacterium]
MRIRVLAVGLFVVVAFGVFHAPTILTGRVLVSDAPVPAGWGDVVESARGGVTDSIGGFYGLRFAGLDCQPMTSPNASVTATVWFDVLGPFRPVTAVVARSGDPFDAYGAGWLVDPLTITAERPDAAAFVPPDAAPCGTAPG